MPGLPGARLIHPRFQQHHRQTVDATMAAECDITRPASMASRPAFDELAATSTHPAPTDVYSGRCRIQRSGGLVQDPVVADRAIPTATYLVAVPADANPIQVGDLVTVTACPDDPDLVDVVLRVTEVRHGSTAWQRNLICDLHPAMTR
jgi:hypothetical protein